MLPVVAGLAPCRTPKQPLARGAYCAAVLGGQLVTRNKSKLVGPSDPHALICSDPRNPPIPTGMADLAGVHGILSQDSCAYYVSLMKEAYQEDLRAVNELSAASSTALILTPNRSRSSCDRQSCFHGAYTTPSTSPNS